MKSRRLALTPAGLCRRTVSKILPVTSPDAIRSAAAATTAASELSTPGAGFLSPVSMTVTARHSVSSWDGAEVFRSIFIGIANLYFYHGDTESRRAQLRFSRAHDGLTGFFVSGATFLGLALVPELLALGKRDLALHATMFKVKTCGDERVALLLCLADEFLQLLFVDEKLSRAWRRVIVDIAVLVWPDMRVQKPELAVFDQSIGVFQVCQAVADGFHFGPAEDDPRLHLVR